MASKGKTLVARQQVVAEVDGKTVIVLEGARLPAGDPIVLANPEQFAPVTPKRKGKR
jgi:hypothetical protein